MTEKVTFGEATSNTWSRPAGVGLLDLFGRAGKGGNESIGAGGSPAAFTVRGLDTVENTLYFYVGGDGDDGIFSGGSGAGGFNGGGNSPGSTQGAGGGGATDVRVGGTALGNRIFVAGGGGGAGSNNAGGGGGADGASGASGSGPTEANGGGGGSQSAGGAGGSGGGNGNNGSAGTLGSGGSGGSSGGLNRSGGGGGGGYYGGGGGEASDTSNESQAAGGGGGSSFIDTGQTYTSGSASLSSGTPTGTIEYSLPPQAPTLTDPPTGTRATPYSDSDPFPLNFTHNPTAGSEGVKTGAGAANDDQSAWAMRRRADGGAWEYWNGTSWVGSYTQVEETTDGSKDVGGVWQGDTTYGYEVGTASYGGTVTNWSAEQEVTFPPLVDGGSVTMPGVGAQDNIDVSAQLNTKVSYTLATNNGVNSPLYEVPPGVNRIYVEMRGSAGESVSGGFGGLGGYFSFAYDVTPGDFVYFRMEGPGSGGNGGSGAGGGDDGGDGGGAVRFDDDPLLFSSPIALAAGGGGAAVGRDGGDVLGPTGENGQDSGAGGGFGASAGSGAGGDAGPNNNNGNSGSTHNGGTAGDGSLAGDSDGGGGGGDGWRSGGGGASGHAGGAGRNGHDGSLGTIIYDTSWKNMGLGESTTAAVVRVVHLAPPLPEQMDGAGTLTATCEVFSFGVPQPQGGVGTQTTDGEVIRI
ncbi:MAG: glycine-rich protein, partial [Acidimicrobiia bacterium]|nr:glycine-rich protein [Acidimicrobiia bacterium]